jgi:hypothetical protein
MKTSTIANYLLLFALIGMMGCNENNSKPDKVQRTYSQAFDFKLITVKQLKSKDLPVPDSVNIKAFIVGSNTCPPYMDCVATSDHIVISDSLNSSSADKYMLIVTEPGQFNKGRQYILSLGVYPTDVRSVYHSKLLGYSEIK